MAVVLAIPDRLAVAGDARYAAAIGEAVAEMEDHQQVVVRVPGYAKWFYTFLKREPERLFVGQGDNGRLLDRLRAVRVGVSDFPAAGVLHRETAYVAGTRLGELALPSPNQDRVGECLCSDKLEAMRFHAVRGDGDRYSSSSVSVAINQGQSGFIGRR